MKFKSLIVISLCLAVFKIEAKAQPVQFNIDPGTQMFNSRFLFGKLQTSPAGLIDFLGQLTTMKMTSVNGRRISPLMYRVSTPATAGKEEKTIYAE